MNAERPHTEPSSIVKKQLFLLEKLYEDWELSGRAQGPIKMHWSRYEGWAKEGGFDDVGQMMSALKGLESMGLLKKAEWVNPAV